MPPITTSTDVDRPAGEVFAYATDPYRADQGKVPVSPDEPALPAKRAEAQSSDWASGR